MQSRAIPKGKTKPSPNTPKYFVVMGTTHKLLSTFLFSKHKKYSRSSLRRLRKVKLTGKFLLENIQHIKSSILR